MLKSLTRQECISKSTKDILLTKPYPNCTVEQNKFKNYKRIMYEVLHERPTPIVRGRMLVLTNSNIVICFCLKSLFGQLYIVLEKHDVVKGTHQNKANTLK